MKTQRLLSGALALILMAGCATNSVEPGNDPIIVNAQTTMELAKSTFDFIEKSEYETYPALKSTNPTLAAQVRTFVNKVRANQAAWLRSANNLKEAYRTAPTSDGYAALQKALAVLSQAITESNGYLAQMGTKQAWLSPRMQLTLAPITAVKRGK